MAKRKSRKPKKYRPFTHPFFFHDNMGGEFEVRAHVIPATAPVDPVLTPTHLRRSIRLKGRGNSQTCAGSICLIENRGLFPHTVIGYCDFSDTRAWVMSKWEPRKEGGWTAECYEYEHSEGWLPKTNDQRGGAQKLLDEMETAGGQGRTLHLRPMSKKQLVPGHGANPRKPTGRKDGSRRRKVTAAKLRYAHMNRGVGVA